MHKLTAPLVGAHFRPPAKALLQILPNGHPLELRADPENEYSSIAIGVWLRSATIPATAYEELALHVGGMGHSVEDILTQSEWHLGYVCEVGNKKQGAQAVEFRQIVGWKADLVLPATLAFDAAGMPLVAVLVGDAVDGEDTQ